MITSTHMMNLVTAMSKNLSEQVDQVVYEVWQVSGLSLEEFNRTYTVEFRRPENTEQIATDYSSDGESILFRIAQEFRVRKRTPEELLHDPSILPGL